MGLMIDVTVDSNTGAGVILVQRRRKWASIAPTLDLDLDIVFSRDRLYVVRRAVDVLLGICFSKDLSK